VTREVAVVRRGTPEFPALLEQIPDPPQQLYVRGKLPPSFMVAVVGSRRATPYGLHLARRFGRELAERGVTVVSGLARGVDGEAHRGALEAGGLTIAVLPAGLDAIYPPEHRELAEAIAYQGALVTEMPEGTAPLPGRFPVRNRIVSGLSRGVLVVEAAQRSGALITARLALEQGREVFALPGNIDNPLTEGTHALIGDGAKLVSRVGDILEEFADFSPAAAAPPASRARARAHAPARTRANSGPQEPELAAVWELLDWVLPRHHDELAILLQLEAQEVSRRLTLLEMGNYIIGDCGAVLRRPRD
jgi:DNA processing protein